MFSEKDKQLLKKKGIHQESIDQQLKSFKNGIDFVNLQAAVTPENGICMPDEEKINFFSGSFVQSIGNYSLRGSYLLPGLPPACLKHFLKPLGRLKRRTLSWKFF